MKLRSYLLISLLILPMAHAQTPPMPLDLIELLGEFDDEDTESLQTALDDIQNTNSKNNAETPKEQGKPLPQEIKK